MCALTDIDYLREKGYNKQLNVILLYFLMELTRPYINKNRNILNVHQQKIKKLESIKAGHLSSIYLAFNKNNCRDFKRLPVCKLTAC